MQQYVQCRSAARRANRLLACPACHPAATHHFCTACYILLSLRILLRPQFLPSLSPCGPCSKHQRPYTSSCQKQQLQPDMSTVLNNKEEQGKAQKGGCSRPAITNDWRTRQFHRVLVACPPHAARAALYCSNPKRVSSLRSDARCTLRCPLGMIRVWSGLLHVLCHAGHDLGLLAARGQAVQREVLGELRHSQAGQLACLGQSLHSTGRGARSGSGSQRHAVAAATARRQASEPVTVKRCSGQPRAGDGTQHGACESCKACQQARCVLVGIKEPAERSSSPGCRGPPPQQPGQPSRGCSQAPGPPRCPPRAPPPPPAPSQAPHPRRQVQSEHQHRACRQRQARPRLPSSRRLRQASRRRRRQLRPSRHRLPAPASRRRCQPADARAALRQQHRPPPRTEVCSARARSCGAQRCPAAAVGGQVGWARL